MSVSIAFLKYINIDINQYLEEEAKSGKARLSYI